MVGGGIAGRWLDALRRRGDLPQPHELAATAPARGPGPRAGIVRRPGEEPGAIARERVVAWLDLDECELAIADSLPRCPARAVEQRVPAERPVRSGQHAERSAARAGHGLREQ